MHGYKLRESPIVLGPTSAFWNEKWASVQDAGTNPSKIATPPALFSILTFELPLKCSIVFSEVINFNGLFLQLVQFICDG